MAENPRIDELRRRIQQDSASLAFAILAEEYRRAGRLHEAVDACRAGLTYHPNYLSARVTLGRSLMAMGELELAKAELELVVNVAPENLVARRGLAEIYEKLGQLPEAIAESRTAFDLARKDFEQTLGRLAAPAASPAAAAAPVAVEETPAPGAGHHPAADDPALAALERFLSALLDLKAQA